MIRTLVTQEHQVFALARSTSSTDRVRSLGATPVTGDLETPEHLSLPEIEAVVHAAAYFRFAGPRSPYFRANVEGTRALLTAAQEAGAATFIYVSAGAVVMDDRGSSIRDADERAPTFPNSFSATSPAKLKEKRPCWRRTSLVFAQSQFDHPPSGVQAIRLAERSLTPSAQASSRLSRAATIRSRFAT
jgi:hypothetical protein